MKIELLKGDCLEEMKKMSDQSVDFSFTSPPYNRKRNDKYENYRDIVDAYLGLLVSSTNEMLRITRGKVFINIQKNYYNSIDVYSFIGKYAEKIREIIIWEKSNPMPAAGLSITNAYEFVIVLGNDSSSLKSNNTYTKNIITTSVNSKMPKNHKAVMHQDVSDWFIEKFTKKGDIVLDCFMGTGTTGISCKSLERGFIGIEIDSEYFKMATEKLSTKKV